MPSNINPPQNLLNDESFMQRLSSSAISEQGKVVAEKEKNSTNTSLRAFRKLLAGSETDKSQGPKRLEVDNSGSAGEPLEIEDVRLKTSDKDAKSATMSQIKYKQMKETITGVSLDVRKALVSM